MNRSEFLKICGILGVGIPFQTTLNSCSGDINDGKDIGKILIIGAGAAGLSAGYLLQQQGVDFEILEASSVHGGRMKVNTEFADFPIPLGAEWLHSSKDEFRKIINDPTISSSINTVNYNSAVDTYGSWENGQLDVSALDDSDIKFVNYSWLNFYNEYIVPSIANKIQYNTVVNSIDYSGDQIIVNTQEKQFVVDKVIVSVPLKILQEGDIIFIPELPKKKQSAIGSVNVWDGFKAFIEFSDKFYDTVLEFKITPATDGQKLYYDAAYGQSTTKNILGLFVVGKPAVEYKDLTGEALKDFILNELDEIYSNKASGNYMKHIAQNWNNEPFIKGGYVSDDADWRSIAELGKSVEDKIYFAGGAYTNGEDWVSVHVAASSAKNAIEELVNF